MSTNQGFVVFEETGNDVVVRIRTTSGGGTFDFTGITDIDFSDSAGVRFVYPNDVATTATVFVPYTVIQQIFQVN